MDQESGSGPSASKIEGLLGGGSTSVSDRRKDDRDSGASQHPNTTTEQVDGFEGTDDSNRGSDVSGLQTTEIKEDTDSKGDHTSGQARPPSVAGSTGNDDTMQTAEGFVIVNHGESDADTVEKGEGCTQVGKTDADPAGKGGLQKIVENTEQINELHQKVSKVIKNLHPDDTTRDKSLKNDPVVAKVGGTEVKCTTDANEVHAQVRIEGSSEAPCASTQGSQSSPATMALPDVVDSRPQGAHVLCKSGSAKEAHNLRKQPHSLRTIKSLRHTFETTTETTVYSSLKRETSTGGVTPSTGIASGSQKEPPEPNSEAPSTASTAEAPAEADTSQGDPSSVSASGAQEEISEASKAPIAGVLDSGPQEVGGSCAELPRTESLKEALTSPNDVSKVSDSGTQEKSNEGAESPNKVVLDSGTQEAVSCPGLAREVSRSGSCKEGFTSPEAAGIMSGSDAQGESTVTIEASRPVPASGAICVVSDPMVQGEVHSPPEVLSPSQVNGGSVETEVLPRAPSCVVSKGVDSMRSDSPSTVRTPTDIRNDPSTNSVVRTEGGDLPSSGCEGEVSGVSEAVSTVADLEAQKSFETNSEENAPRAEVRSKVPAPESLRRTVSQAGKEILRKPLQMAPHQSETTISDAPEGLPRPISAERGEPSVPEGDAAGSDPLLSTTQSSLYQEQLVKKDEELAQKGETITELTKTTSTRESLRRTASQAGEEILRNSLQMSAHQSETTVRDAPEGLPRPIRAGGEPSVPKGDLAGSDPFLTTHAFRYQEQLVEKDAELALRDEAIAKLTKAVGIKESQLSYNRGQLQGLKQDYDGQVRKNEELLKIIQDVEMAQHRMAAEWNNQQKYVIWCNRRIKDLEGQLEQTKKECDSWRKECGTLKKECSTLQEQLSLYEQQHASEQCRGGSYLDDTKAATPALLVSALNGVKDASNNFVKVLKSSIQPGIEDELRKHIGAVSRNGHVKFQYQAYVCGVLFVDFEHPYTGVSKAVLPPTTYFRHYKLHDMKKTDTVDRLLRCDPEIDPSLRNFCFDKFSKLMNDIQNLLIDKSVDLRQLVQSKEHPRESKLYVSFCKLAVSVWLLQRLAFSFLQPAKPFIADGGVPFDQSRMQSVVPLDEPSADEEVELMVGFYVLPGFDIGNSTVPCEVYVTALK